MVEVKAVNIDAWFTPRMEEELQHWCDQGWEPFGMGMAFRGTIFWLKRQVPGDPH